MCTRMQKVLFGFLNELPGAEKEPVLEEQMLSEAIF